RPARGQARAREPGQDAGHLQLAQPSELAELLPVERRRRGLGRVRKQLRDAQDAHGRGERRKGREKREGAKTAKDAKTCFGGAPQQQPRLSFVSLASFAPSRFSRLQSWNTRSMRSSLKIASGWSRAPVTATLPPLARMRL